MIDKVFKELDAKYPELKNYGTDSEDLTRKFFLTVREFMLDHEQITIKGFGRFLIKPGRLWRECFKLYEKLKELGSNEHIEKRIEYLVSVYNKELDRKKKRKQPLQYLKFENKQLTTNGFTDSIHELADNGG